MKTIKVGDVIAKSGTRFLILDVTDKHYLAEQSSDGTIDSYEVGRIVVKEVPKTREKYLTIPQASVFGRGIDKSFGKTKKQEAIEYFNNIKSALV